MKSNYEVIIIGNTIDCLLAGGLLAQKGLQVLIVGNKNEPGGYIRPISIDGFIFEPCLTFVQDSQGIVKKVLSELKIYNESNFIGIPSVEKIIFPDFEVNRPAGLKQYSEILAEMFPAEKKSLLSLFDTIYAACLENWLTLEQQTVKPSQIPVTMKYFNKTYVEFIEEFVNNEKLKSILLSPIPWYGIAFVTMCGYWGQISDVGYHRRGWSGLINDIMEGIRRDNIDIENSAEVKRILVENNRAIGIELESGGKVEASFILSGYDLKFTFLTFFNDLPADEKTYKEITQPQNTLPYFSLFLGLNNKHKIYTQNEIGWYTFFSTYDIKQLFEDLKDADCYPKPKMIRIYFPTKFYPFLAPMGKGILRIDTLTNYHFWAKLKGESLSDVVEQFKADLLEMVKQIFPEFTTSDIEVCKVLTPIDFEKMMKIKEGAGTSWAHSCEQVLANPLRQKFFIKNIYTLGQWGWGWFYSAKVVSDLILRDFSKVK